MRKLFASLLFITIVSLPLLRAISAEPSAVSRTPPAEFEQLKPFLTPWETAKTFSRAPDGHKGEAKTETILQEQLFWVEESGRCISVRHQLREVLTDAGIKVLSEALLPYNAGRERSYLFLARTICPDGSVVDVEEKAAFLKRPDSGADAFYTDEEELRLIFPKVTKGAILESILVRETFKPIMPGEFGFSIPWGYSDGVRRMRIVGVIPQSMRERLRWQVLGTSLPEPKEQELPGNRVLLEWCSDRLEPLPWESGGPRLSQVGPSLRAGTVKNWDEVGKWFAGLMSDASIATDEVKSAAAEWAKEAKTPREIAEKLYGHVTNDIRYTGLEFGDGSHQPREARAVLSTKYGDCKDKSNLLRVLLREHGIPSRMVLLNTEHAGYIDRTIPAAGRFSHAILEIQLPGEEPLYCDPTIPKLRLGVLPAADADRDVLLVDEKGAVEWAHIPAQSTGNIDATFDLQLEPGGGYSGWVTLKLDRLLAARVLEEHAKATREDFLSRLASKHIAGMRGGKVIDYELSETKPGEVTIRAYLVKLGTKASAGGRERVLFPMLSFHSPAVGNEAARTTTLFSYIGATRQIGTCRLPEGWLVLDLPEPFERDLSGYQIRQSWSESPDGLRCEASANTTKTSVTAAEHGEIFRARKDALAWLDNPAFLKSAAGDKAKEWKPEAVALPKMCTPEGQFALIETRFPLDPNNIFAADFKSRLAAYSQAGKYFPDNLDLQFAAEFQAFLAEFVADDDHKGLPERIRKVIEKYRNKVDKTRLSAAQLVLVSALLIMEEGEEALPLAEVLAQDQEAPELVRQMASLGAAAVLEPKEPERAYKYIQVALKARSLPDEAAGLAACIALKSLARRPGLEAVALVAEYDGIFERYKGQAEEIVANVMEVPPMLIDRGYLREAALVVDALKSISKKQGTPDTFQDELEDVVSLLEEARAAAPVQSQVVEWLKENPWPDLDKVEPGDVVDSASECSDAMLDHDAIDINLRYALRRLVRYGPQPDFTDNLEEAVALCGEWLDEPKEYPKPPKNLEQLEEALLQIWDTAPLGENVADGPSLFRGTILRRKKGATAALDYYRGLAADAASNRSTKAAAHEAAADILEEQKDYSALAREWKALAAVGAEEDYQRFHFRSLYLSLANGERATAWECVSQIAALPEGSFDDAACRRLQEEVKLWAKDRARMERWWDASAKWWRDWETLRKKAKISVGDERVGAIPLIAPQDAMTQAEVFVKHKNRAAFARLLAESVESARWEKKHTAIAVKLLREYGVKEYPDQAKAIRKLAGAIEASP